MATWCMRSMGCRSVKTVLAIISGHWGRAELMDNTGRISRLYDLMDEQLSEINDNPVYEQYRSRSISNYAQAIKTLMEVERNERQVGNTYSCKK